MTKIKAGESVFNISPAIGPSHLDAPTQPVTSFGSASAAMQLDLHGASCSMVVLGHTPEAAVLDELVTDLWLLGDFPMRYRIWAVWQDFDIHGDDRVSFQGVTYERLLNRRLVGAGGLLYENTDVGTILWAAIQHTQAKPGGDLGIIAGSMTTGITTSIDWLPGENIGIRIEEMMQAAGCYWVIDEDKQANVYVREDTTPILEPLMWGVNVSDLQRASAGVGFSNSVFMSGTEQVTPVFATHPHVDSDPRGLWEAAVARPTETSQDELLASANGELDVRFQALSRWNVTYVTEHWVGASRIRPGDRAELKVPRTLAGVITPPESVQVECVSMSFAFDGDGGLEVKAVFEELPTPYVESDPITTTSGIGITTTSGNQIGTAGGWQWW